MVVNQSRVDFQFRTHLNAPIISQTIFSNIVSTVILKDILKAEKVVDKVLSTVFDILTYTIRITNLTDRSVTHVFFQDPISEGTKFIANSLKLNEVRIRCVNPDQGFNMGLISPGSFVLISFKVVVLPQYAGCYINNYTEITYDYIYNVELPPIRATIRTNEVCTKIENKLFKQFNISNILKVPSASPLIHSIVDITVKIEIFDTKIVGTPIICESSLCNLIVIGTVEYNVLYKDEKLNSRLSHKLRDIEGFSSFMLVPYGIEYCPIKNKNITILIENISNILINKQSVFIDTTVLMHL